MSKVFVKMRHILAVAMLYLEPKRPLRAAIDFFARSVPSADLSFSAKEFRSFLLHPMFSSQERSLVERLLISGRKLRFFIFQPRGLAHGEQRKTIEGEKQ